MTIKADTDYRLYIQQVEDIINREEKPTLKEFAKEYCNLYDLPIQGELFE